MIWEVNCPHFAGRRVVDLRRDVVREEEEDDDSEDEDDDDMPEVTASNGAARVGQSFCYRLAMIHRKTMQDMHMPSISVGDCGCVVYES